MKVFIQPDVAVCKSAILNKFSTHIFFIANSPVECGYWDHIVPHSLVV